MIYEGQYFRSFFSTLDQKIETASLITAHNRLYDQIAEDVSQRGFDVSVACRWLVKSHRGQELAFIRNKGGYQGDQPVLGSSPVPQELAKFNFLAGLLAAAGPDRIFLKNEHLIGSGVARQLVPVFLFRAISVLVELPLQDSHLILGAQNHPPNRH